MIRRSSRLRVVAWASTSSRLARSLVLVVWLVGLLSACASPTPEEPLEKTINFANDVLPGRTVLDVQRVDTDGDSQMEWVVFYRFDQVENRGPVAALIYDVVRDPASQLPVVYPYKLRMPDQSYLAQTQPKVSLEDIVPESAGAASKELVFATDLELAFFRVNAGIVNQPLDNPPLYRCIGFFRSDGGVSFDPSIGLTVTVTSRAGYERSQLVTRYYYKPEADGYFITGTTTLVSAFSSAVDFPEGIPTAILDTPYPEKIVLAFYKTFGKSDAKPTILEYLTTQAANEFMQGRLKYGSPFPLDLLRFAVVKELSYYPTQDDSQATTVTVKVIFHSTSGQKSSLTEVRWTLIRDQTRWKMDFPQS